MLMFFLNVGKLWDDVRRRPQLTGDGTLVISVGVQLLRFPLDQDDEGSQFTGKWGTQIHGCDGKQYEKTHGFLVGGLEPWKFDDFPLGIFIPTDELIFFRGVGIPPISFPSVFLKCIEIDWIRKSAKGRCFAKVGDLVPWLYGSYMRCQGHEGKED